VHTTADDRVCVLWCVVRACEHVLSERRSRCFFVCFTVELLLQTGRRWRKAQQGDSTRISNRHNMFLFLQTHHARRCRHDYHHGHHHYHHHRRRRHHQQQHRYHHHLAIAARHHIIIIITIRYIKECRGKGEPGIPADSVFQRVEEDLLFYNERTWKAVLVDVGDYTKASVFFTLVGEVATFSVSHDFGGKKLSAKARGGENVLDEQTESTDEDDGEMVMDPQTDQAEIADIAVQAMTGCGCANGATTELKELTVTCPGGKTYYFKFADEGKRASFTTVFRKYVFVVGVVASLLTKTKCAATIDPR
jgi:hypothetical protein